MTTAGPNRDLDISPAPDRPGLTKVWLAALQATASLCVDPQTTLADVLDDLGRRHAGAPALLSDRESFSFEQMAAQVRRYTRWAVAQQLGQGDVVALMASNRPDYFNLWAGISRTGATVALLNTNLADRALAHCLAAAGPAHLIIAPAFVERYRAAAVHLPDRPRLWLYGEASAGGDVPLDLGAYSDAPLAADERKGAALTDRALHIYTSGTTGLPKAANVSHQRVLTWGAWFSAAMVSGPADRLYNCLPMYHSVGGVAVICGALFGGGSVVVRDKFSASQFWPDVVRWRCTIFQYIGELCRYLLSAPPHADEARHSLRLACGNGLREEVWTPFQARFHIPAILEFYAATENNFSLFNIEGRPGSIGRVPSFLAHRFPAVLVRYDTQTEQPVRTAAGHCVACEPQEVGEAIGRLPIDLAAGHANRFEGYTSAAETDRKILRDVFVQGDRWLRTGDLMRRDEAGFFYFVDRIGDTFRWKGENVSASEVAGVLLDQPGVLAAAVYGVEAPGAEGRAGMAAIVVGHSFDIAALGPSLAHRLPRYARPVFIRIVDRLETTETFKLKKQALIQEGFDPAQVSQALYICGLRDHAYAPLNRETYARVVSGDIPL